MKESYRLSHPARKHGLFDHLSIIGVLVAALGVTGVARAQNPSCATSGNCNVSPFDFAGLTALKKFKVNSTNAAAVTNNAYDVTTGTQAVVLAASAWNEQANGIRFRFAGNDNSATDVDCGSEFSLVVFRDGCCDVGSFKCTGYTEERCGGSHFIIYIFRQGQTEGVCFDRFSENGAVTGGRDLPGLLVHEFGHVHDMTHTETCDEAVMTSAGDSWGGYYTARRRNLYSLDLLCTYEVAGNTTRSLTGYSQVHSSAGFGGASACTSAASVAKVSSGLTKDGSTFYWASGQHRRTTAAWDEAVTNDSTWVALTNPGVQNGVGFVAGYFRETDTIDRVFYSYHDDYGGPEFEFDYPHHVRQIRSSSEFGSGAQTASYFQHCSSMNGSMGCTSKKDLVSARQMAFAFLDFSSGTDRTVAAWINQDNSQAGNNYDANRVKVAIGLVDDNTLAQPDDLPDFSSPTALEGRSAVGPAVVCSENFSGSQDCIVAWVPIDDESNSIKVVRFSVTAPGGGSNRYTATFESTVRSLPSTSQTANSITGWWNSTLRRFYLAYRTSTTDQMIDVVRSSDGVTWTSDTAGLDYSDVPPSAASMWDGSNNLLIYAK